MTTNASPTKLKNGSWGVRIQGKARAGDTVHVRTRAGKEWDAVVERVIWSGPDRSSGRTVSLCSTVSTGAQRGSSREMCAECFMRPATTEAADASGLVAGVCRACAQGSRYERSFA